MVQGSPDNIEVTAAGVNKGESLLALADHLGIPREATLAVGDSENDRAMLEKAGVAAVMANGMEHIRRLADIVSENDNDHDGVAEIFARLGLMACTPSNGLFHILRFYAIRQVAAENRLVCGSKIVMRRTLLTKNSF